MLLIGASGKPSTLVFNTNLFSVTPFLNVTKFTYHITLFEKFIKVLEIGMPWQYFGG